MLSTTTVNVALPELVHDLKTGVGSVQWVTSGYLLAMCLVIPAAAWLQGRIGAARLWVAGLGLFLLGSAGCAVAWDVGSLVLARVVQGLGGGAIVPLLTTVLFQATPPRDRMRLASLVGLVTAIGPVLGPVLGGAVVEAGSWRWLFWLNVPLALVGLVAARHLPSDERPSSRRRFDVIGFVLLAPGLSLALVGLTTLPDRGNRQWSSVAALAGAFLVAGFVIWALRRPAAALVDLHVLRVRATWSASIALMLAGAVAHGAFVLLPLASQQRDARGALAAGLLLVPQGLGAMASRTPALWLVERRGARLVAVMGFALVAVSTYPFATIELSLWSGQAVTLLILRGLGLGMLVVPLLAMAFDGHEHGAVPHASVVVRMAQQFGGASGVAILVVAVVDSSGGDAGFAFAFLTLTGMAVTGIVASCALPGRDKPLVVTSLDDAAPRAIKRRQAGVETYHREPHGQPRWARRWGRRGGG